jgi:hypothetical protein
MDAHRGSYRVSVKLLFYKSLNHLCPEYNYLNTFFIQVHTSQVHTRTTRSSSANDLYLLPRKYTEQIYMDTFGYSSVRKYMEHIKFKH